jgi:hypothetical protein
MQQKPINLNHEKRFSDITSHWSRNISRALSKDNFYYVWGDCREENNLIPIRTEFKSFNDIFAFYFECNFEFSKKLSNSVIYTLEMYILIKLMKKLKNSVKEVLEQFIK